MKTNQTHKVLSFVCDVCGKHYENKPPYNFCPDMTPGYGKNDKGQIVCYVCCAEADKKQMIEVGEIALYLDTVKWELTNWPGSLRISIRHQRQGLHNIAGKRYDVWFAFDGRVWHGVQYGDNTQICHCKKTKQTA